MNRPIKFRVWDFFHKQWITGAAIELNGCIIDTSFAEPETNCVALQYTGLTDKNGKEIYEGDIINLKFGELNANLVVKWDKYMGLKYHNGGWTSLVHVETHGEVIGNIFEHENLLK
jgi:uncharacterized phage protein (TIGR01671 family)